MGKNPAFQFYPGDWERDLKEHPLEIRGAWITICCSLWWGEERGKSKKPLTNWSRVLGVPERKSLSIINYLNEAGIADINNDNGLIEISCRRMLRDEKIRGIRKITGSLGGNPAFEKGQPNPYYLDNQEDKQKDNQKISTDDNQKITPSVLLSSSSKINTFDLDSKPYKLACYLLQIILDRKPDLKKPDLQKWANAFDLMIRIDNRNPDRIAQVIEWSQKDLFWKNNILSPDKLRKQFDNLELKMEAK